MMTCVQLEAKRKQLEHMEGERMAMGRQLFEVQEQVQAYKKALDEVRPISLMQPLV